MTKQKLLIHTLRSSSMDKNRKRINKQVLPKFKRNETKSENDTARLSYKSNTPRTIKIKKDLTSRQFCMIIFGFLGRIESLQVQLLNKRFYQGIVPHWFRVTERARLEIRETESRNNELLGHHVELDFPSQLSLKEVTLDQFKAL